MVKESENMDFFSIKAIWGNFANMIKNIGKQEKPEELKDAKLQKELTDALNKVDTLEKTVRIGEIEAKVAGKTSINKRPTFSKGTSLGVRKAEVSKDTILGEKTYEER